MADFLKGLEASKVLQVVIEVLLEPQQVIDNSLLPVLRHTESAERLAAIINLVPKEVSTHT